MVEPSEDFPIAVTVLASDPARADVIIGSRWMVFDSVVGWAVCSSAKLLMDIRWEAVGMFLGRYGGNRRKDSPGVLPGYGRV